jgi:hypothetical protein
MIYKLSNIARSTIKNPKNDKYNILYYPNGSAIDSVIASIPNIRLYFSEYFGSDIDAIITYEDAHHRTLLEYHRPIIYLNLENKPIKEELRNIYTIEFNDQHIKNIFFTNTNEENSSRDNILYVTDTSQEHYVSVCNVLKKNNIDFDIMQHTDLYNLNIFDLYNIFSKYRAVLHNTNTITLYAALAAGCRALSFNTFFSTTNTEIEIITENSIPKVSTEKENKYNKPQTNDAFLKFTETVKSLINQTSARAFTL